MHLLYQKTAKNAVAIRFVNYSVDIIYTHVTEKAKEGMAEKFAAYVNF